MSNILPLGQSFWDIVNIPVGAVLNLIYQFIGNYGLTIIIFGIVVKLCMLPISISSEKSRLQNMRMQPKLQALQAKYKNDTRNPKYQEEMQRLYEKEGFSPMKGCLPMLIQFPIIFAVFNAIRRPMSYIYHMNYGSGDDNLIVKIAKKLFELGDPNIVNVFGNDITRITDSSAQVQEMLIAGSMKEHFADVQGLFPQGFSLAQENLIDMNFLGMNLAETPTFGFNWTIVIPIMSALTSLIISLISIHLNKPQNGEKNAMMGTTKIMMLFMPLFSLWVGFNYTVGVGLYWVVSNLLSALQMYVLAKIFQKKRDKLAAELAAKEMNKEKKLNYNQIEKMEREKAEAARLEAKKEKK